MITKQFNSFFFPLFLFFVIWGILLFLVKDNREAQENNLEQDTNNDESDSIQKANSLETNNLVSTEPDSVQGKISSEEGQICESVVIEQEVTDSEDVAELGLNSNTSEISSQLPLEKNPDIDSNFESVSGESQSLSKPSEAIREVGHRQFKIRSFQIPKLGLSEAECEDKSSLSSQNTSQLRIAVADGATESLFSDVWADILVNSYLEQGTELFTPSALESSSQKFVQNINQLILQMPETRHWFMYEKLDRGTHATLAAVEISHPETINIFTVGDSCVFWRNGNTTNVEMLPKLSPNDFGSFPASICHIATTWISLEKKIAKLEVSFEASDSFHIAICTDALACWLATELQNGDTSAWEKLFQLSDDVSFTNFIAVLREQSKIRNDDVTLVLINALPLNV